jgi:5-formyltetrahydrofolate cyclo-ligase
VNVDRGELRRDLRELRRSIPASARDLAATAVRDRLDELGWLDVTSIALYRPTDGELDPEPAAMLARRAAATTWYPVVDGTTMRFARWDGATPLRRGPYDIEEPASDEWIEPSALSVVLVPVVGFDDRGTRLGMGLGFYDRTFAFTSSTGRHDRPRLVGVAFDEQRCDRIDREAWDVTLDAIVTPTATITPQS